MSIIAHNPFKGRQYPGEVIILCVRWYLRYPLSYEHVSELVAERGVDVLAVGKRPETDAHTALAAGGINAALATMDPEDSWRQHAAFDV